MQPLKREVLLSELIQLLNNNESVQFLTNEQVAEFARRGVDNVQYIQHGQTIITEGDTDNNWFFVVVRGEVAAYRTTDNNPQLLNYSGPGAIVGIRALLYDQPRAASVQAVRDSIIVRYSREDWVWLTQQNDEFRRFFEKLESRFDAGSLGRFPGRQPDEVVVVSAKRHWLALVGKLQWPVALLIVPVVIMIITELLGIPFLSAITETLWVVLLAPFFVVSGLLILYHYFDWRNDDFIVTTKRVLHIERILFYGEERHEAPLVQIQSVTVQSHNWLDMFFDVDDIEIKTAAVGTIRVDNLPSAQILSQLILNEQQRAKERVAALDVDALRTLLNKRVNKDILAVTQSGKAASPIVKQRRILPLKAIPVPNLKYFVPQVRVVSPDGKTITWRKHYLILLQRIFLPFVSILVTLYLILASLVSLPPMREFGGPIIVILLILLLSGLFVWYSARYDSWRRDIYIVSENKIVDVESSAFKLRGEHRREGSFDSIQSITYNIPNVFSQILNLGDVTIETASNEGNFTFRRVFSPSAVQEEVFNRWDQFQRRKRERQRDDNYQQIVDVIGEYHDIEHAKESGTVKPPTT